MHPNLQGLVLSSIKLRFENQIKKFENGANITNITDS